MPAENDNPEDKAAPAKPLAGLRLREAREAQKRELADIARELHVDLATLRSIEANDFEALGAPVFAKGHMRKYAEALKLDALSILDDYRAMQASNELPPVVAPRPPGRKFDAIPAWFYGLLAAFLILGILLWWFLGSAPEVETSGEQSALTLAATNETDSAPSSLEIESDASEDLSLESFTTDPEEPAVESETAVQQTAVVTARATPAGNGNSVLAISFDDSCWTEIRDASGRRLYSGTAVAGEQRQLTGKPPFRVVLGNRRAVSIRLDGEDYGIPANAIRGRTARFTIPAP